MKKKRNQLEELFIVLGSPSIREALLTLNRHNTMTYGELSDAMGIKPVKIGLAFGEEMTPDRKERYQKSTRMSYYFRKMKASNLVMKDKGSTRYRLTRIGIVCLNLIEKFEKLIDEYENDSDEEQGVVHTETRVLGRKVKDLDEA